MKFKRKIYDEMLRYKAESKGKTALLIEGARRIGKTTIVKGFAKNEYKSFIYIDFSFEKDGFMDNLFKNISDLDHFFLELQLRYNVDLHKRESLIIFDEVQFFPFARQAIKFLVQDGWYDYIETGSLIFIKKNVKDILIPSEEHKINMYPLDIQEVRWALRDTSTDKLIEESFENRIPVSKAVNRKLMRDFRLYMLIGGMPQAINEYINTNNFRCVDYVKRDIINLYESDLRKFDNSGVCLLIYNSFVSNFSSRIKRFAPSAFLKKTGVYRI